MAVAFFMDVHIPRPITEQLRRRGVDVLTAREDGADELEDDEVLERAALLGRVVFTQDLRFKAMAEDWQRQGRPFAGLVFGPQLRTSIGKYVKDLELIAKASQIEEWRNWVEHLPY